MSPIDRDRPSTTPPVPAPAPEGEAETVNEEAPAAAPPSPPPQPQRAADEEPSVPESVRQKLEAWVPDLVRKAVSAGMGAVLASEEGIRRLTKEMPMPKEVAGYLVSTASSTKDDLLRIVAREVREFLSTVNLSEEIAKMLTMLSFEVKTEIRFIPNSEKYAGVEPDVKARVRLKRTESKTAPAAAPTPARRMFRRRRRSEGNPAEGE
jgi:hypothetical protein